MKMFLKRKLSLFLAVIFLVPILGNMNVAEASTATPALTQTKIELAGIGETYDLNVKNKVAKSTYSWTSSNKTVATVNKSGLVTAINNGTANINCKITYPTKKTKTLSCKVTVTIPATDISISNVALENNAYKMTVGSTADFETVLTPANSTDKTYWIIDQNYSDAGCIRIDDAQAGKITAVKAGKVALIVRAAKESTKAAADASMIDAGIIIEVVEPSASVKSADITGPNELTVVFDSPIQQSTVIGVNNKLSDNIVVSALKNTKNVLANDPGTLTASLSTDLKTLTITSVNRFEGDYRISFTSNIVTTGGVAIEDYIKNITYTDVVPPYVTNVTLDDSGVIATINFNEVIDFANFKVSSAQIASTSGEAASALTLSILSTTSNYIISADKKSVKINMANITSTDFGKAFTVIMSGIKDLSGNVPTTAYLSTTLYTDKTVKPQAQLVSVERTSYYTLTATFDRAIQFGGLLSIDNGLSITGYPDTTNNKKVNFTMSEAEAKYTGTRSVSVGYWNSFNVNSTDTTGRTPVIRQVFFDVDKTSPNLSTYVYDATTGILTLTYNENVTLATSTGAFTARLATASEEIKEGYNVFYTVVPHTEGNNIIKLKLTNMTTIGYYTFSLAQGFVTDSFKNPTLSTSVTISNANGSAELPGPYMVTQSLTNPSLISLEFASKVDLASAQNVSNYKITGVTILSAVVTNNTATGATVVLTVLDGSIDVTVERYLTITGVMGYNGSYAAITTYSKSVELKDNKKPYYINAVYDSASKTAVRLNFSEAMQGNLIVNVTMISNSSTSTPVTNSVIVSGNIATINLIGIVPTNGSYLKIDIVSSNLSDLSGNVLNFTSTTLGVGVTY